LATPKEIAKKITLDLTGIPTSKKSEVKQEVGDFVRDEILREVAQGKSPVSGEGTFARLNKDYAKNEKGGNTTPNLELDGDMLDALEYRNTRDGIKIGIFKSSEVPKADGHNNFSGDSRLPQRRFIPEEDQSFKSRIEKGIQRIVDEYKEGGDDLASTIRNINPPGRPPLGTTPKKTTQIELSDILSDENLAAFLLGEI
jgi:hypothetical protein